ncbi:hypothetical protein NDU88_005520 [Pleurodeles waltl]|uniref:Uncharacterized protein n=1 Tax=Pleurodeles waltl TaxID=8319 RepID=A0AAV7SLY7_PLEWA|nr:hypothetical protein NDU88_005520 [Pleurodeles waltl]
MHGPSRSGAAAIIRPVSPNAVKETGKPIEGKGEQLLSGCSASRALRTDCVRSPGWAGPTGLSDTTTRQPSCSA